MNTASAVVAELKRLGDATSALAAQRYFKTGPGEYGEGDVFLGIRAADLRRVARGYSLASLPEIHKLLHSRFHEARLGALLILLHAYERGDDDLRAAVFDLYLANTDLINNWDLVDLSAPKIVGAHLGPGRHALLTRLAKSKSLWERRIAILATFWFIRHDHFAETLRIAHILLHDEHDLIHKAVGWALREVGKRDRQVEEAFLRKHGTQMPRTMLRYAIERFPEPLRQEYLRAV